MLKTKSKRLLILSHEASFTGAPILLLELLHLMKKHFPVKFYIVIVRGGPLVSEFEKLGPVVVLKPVGYSNRKGINKLKEIILNRLRVIKVFLKAMQCDAIFSNSIINGKVLSWLRFSGKPIYTYVHELKSVIEHYLKQGNAKGSFKYSASFFYPCETVKHILIHSFQVPEQKLFRLNYYFPVVTNESETALEDRTLNNFSFCGVGTASHRKGTDIFIEVAHKVLARKPNYRFTWIGGFESAEAEDRYRLMVKRGGASDAVEFTGPLTPERTKELYQSFDGLLLTSREDPYPLVVLEAAGCKKPSIVFKDAGGISEFVENAGWMIDSIDAAAMADSIVSISKEEMLLKGKEAFGKVVAMHSNQQLIIKQIKFIFDI